MGQKVNPHGLRVGVIKDWDSRWYAEADFADYLVEDYNIRTFLKKKLYSAGVSKIEIERASDRVKIIIYTAKPGIVIGKGGSEIEKHPYPDVLVELIWLVQSSTAREQSRFRHFVLTLIMDLQKLTQLTEKLV